MEKEILIKKRWLRALKIAKILFEDNGYFIDYLNHIKKFIDTHKDSVDTRRKTQGGIMLPYDKNTGIPVCPVCGQEIHEVFVKRLITSYFVFDKEQHHYIRTQRETVFDDNVFRCSECKAPITSKDLFETLASVANEHVTPEASAKH